MREILKRNNLKFESLKTGLFTILYIALLQTANCFNVHIDGIEPNAGLLSGQTRVLVRGGPFNNNTDEHPNPKCKFGSDERVVNGTYVICHRAPKVVGEEEPMTGQKDEWCLQCDNSPSGEKAEIVPFTVSLIGDFSDSENSVAYRYYKDPKIWAIYPKYGKKNGGTWVQVWGENFLNFDQYTRCAFGTKEVPGIFVNSNYMYCYSPPSDVVQKPMPFSITMNNQQNSIDDVYYWYYQFPSITELLPARGPDDGGTSVLLKGNNFDPFSHVDVDNHNDTFCHFEGLAMVPAKVINSTKAICISPPSYILRESNVELTLNNQEYTDNNRKFFYFRPPFVFDIEPREGPTKGGTEVFPIGSNFRNTTHIKCRFDDIVVKGEYISHNRIKCISPKYPVPKRVPLSVALEPDEFSSGQTVQYLYYETPIIDSIEPICGPERGYTQITVYGKNFVNMGFGKAQCVFNETIHTNATIMEHDIIKCDSPPAVNWFRFNEDNIQFYFVKITLNGREISGPEQKFYYYKEADIYSVTPNLGPIAGGTLSKIEGRGFNQIGVCNMTVRYATYQVKPLNYTEKYIFVESPAVETPDDVVVAVGMNGQQWTPDLNINYKDKENTFTYYTDPYVYWYGPQRGPSGGNTPMTIKGKGFLPLKDENGTVIHSDIWIRFTQIKNQKLIAEESKAEIISDEELLWHTPPSKAGMKTFLEMSLNRQNFVKIVPMNAEKSFIYYDSPQIKTISPQFGPVRSKTDDVLEVSGKNFKCLDDDCADLFCRFGTPPNDIKTKGTRISDTKVECPIPKYAQPEILDVEITLNGEDYTNDKQQYGYYDPFILNVHPRLINPNGTTEITIFGYGFVNSTVGKHLKVKFDNPDNKIKCKEGTEDCVLFGEFVSKNEIKTKTFKQTELNYESTQQNIELDGFAPEVSVFDYYTENNITVWYYTEPEFDDPRPHEVPANQEANLMIQTDFKWDVNPKDRFYEYGNFTCRFTSFDGKKVVYTNATILAYPISDDEEPNTVSCKSPKWDLDPLASEEEVKVDVSVNGFDYSGDKRIIIREDLDIYRLVPLCGPNEGGTNVRIFGTGLRLSEDISVKWGVLHTNQVLKDSLSDYVYNKALFESNVVNKGTVAQRSFESEKYSDTQYELVEGKAYQSISAISPKLSNWSKTHGGPVYLELGENNFLDVSQSTEQIKIYQYTNSYLEYFYYKQPVVKDIYPHSGVSKGGTLVQISGAWFKYKPQYGVMPHCKFGDKIVRGHFVSTVRIVCESPAKPGEHDIVPIEVSLNAVDFTETGFEFNYYDEPNISHIYPTTGPESGGTEVRIFGQNFSNHTFSKEFECRFTPKDSNIPSKSIPAKFENNTSILCLSPGGWGQGREALVQLTYNGQDASSANETFYFYNIISVDPLSGPADGRGGLITVKGTGFINVTTIYCSLNKELYRPYQVKEDRIYCPMRASENGPDSFENVKFAVTINGQEWHDYSAGFQYYEQPIVEDIYPKHGPDHGHGVINFYGKNFRSDFQQARLGCKVGPAFGYAEVLSTNEMRCHLDDIPLLGVNQTYPAQVALNNYSWTIPNENTFFAPYGIHTIQPNSGPITGDTIVTIIGDGFFETPNMRCRFGVPGNYATVEAKMLSNQKILCKSPKKFAMPPTGELPFTIPFGIAFNEDTYQPWTQSGHSFRFYEQPKISKAVPFDVNLHETAEVYVYAGPKSTFYEPVSQYMHGIHESSIACKYGPYGSAPGFYINATMVKCLVPSLHEQAKKIYREKVKLSIAMNGQDYNDELSNADVVLIGSGKKFSFWPWLFGTILLALLIIAIFMCVMAQYQKMSLAPAPAAPARSASPQNKQLMLRGQRGGPNVHANAYGNMEPNFIPPGARDSSAPRQTFQGQLPGVAGIPGLGSGGSNYGGSRGPNMFSNLGSNESRNTSMMGGNPAGRIPMEESKYN